MVQKSCRFYTRLHQEVNIKTTHESKNWTETTPVEIDTDKTAKGRFIL